MLFEKFSDKLEYFKNGGIVILVDDKDREDEGDFCQAAEFVTPQSINFVTKEGRGLVCCAMAPELVDKFALPLMVNDKTNNSKFHTPFTISVEAAKGVTTGISTYDRALTINILANPNSNKNSIVTPGHIFPLRAQKDGVLKRKGQTEGSVDLCKITNLTPACMICEILDDDGTMAREKKLQEIAEKFKMPIITIAEIIEHRNKTEREYIQHA